MTHAYFVFYHSLANVCIRRALRAFGGESGGGGKEKNKKNNTASSSGRRSSKSSSFPSLLPLSALQHRLQRLRRPLVVACVVFPLSYFTAFMETATIAHFPHYRFRDRRRMYSVGSLFYAVYFFVSFPWFYAMDEDDCCCRCGGEEGGGGGEKEEKGKEEQKRRWSPARAAADALAAGMLVTILLDAWRLLFGGIVPASDLPPRGMRLPWML